MPANAEPTTALRICLLRLSAIGDTCNVLPIVRTLQAVWPRAQLTWVIGRTEHRLLSHVEGVEFVVFDKRGGRTARRALIHELRGRRFDVLLHMHASLRANLLSRHIPAPRRIGFNGRRARDFQRFFCNEQISGHSDVHVVDGFFQFLEHLGIQDRHLTWNIPIDPVDQAFAKEQMPEPTMLISPCSSQRWRNFRNWRAENYAQLAEHVHRAHGVRVVLTGGPTELEAEYGHRIGSLANAPINNLIGNTTLPQLLALIARAHCVVCPDSGPAHMATATGTPVVGLYATSNRHRTGPFLSQKWVVDGYQIHRIRRADAIAETHVSNVFLDCAFHGFRITVNNPLLAQKRTGPMAIGRGIQAHDGRSGGRRHVC
ncbi:MAG: glycosyltransferase family 9 protein, partial [Pseudomonadota bacterium]